MPMSKLIQQGKHWLGKLQPCQLCHSDYQAIHSVCQDCWQQLPWAHQTIQRQEIQIQIACHYDYPMDRLIQLFKYEQKLYLENLLAGVLLSLNLPKVSAVVPMPISTDKLVQRGYNQSLLLAKQVAKHLKVPVWQPVSRLKQHSQKGLSRLERIEDIEAQFQISTSSKLRYRKVLIIDDVVTTGSSLRALSQKLEELGCQQIYAACVAGAKL
ncbi:amidophosphoribosyltransferase [Acinetobacter sp. LoGeW2-3]|uniref:ComF family protein n=1 Tax=Acinetobacter sp. LoGeW2-3 TaxID=1808001 RepID=UPI000C05A549|nr:phosphoribosyltransferase family protein [Acinetobacter sp. LoGeW2-3]ATO19484.1 amidophosphoribosyltransferase [Acinetobacter sp. LoGeW2-3]